MGVKLGPVVVPAEGELANGRRPQAVRPRGWRRSGPAAHGARAARSRGPSRAGRSSGWVRKFLLVKLTVSQQRSTAQAWYEERVQVCKPGQNGGAGTKMAALQTKMATDLPQLPVASKHIGCRREARRPAPGRLPSAQVAEIQLGDLGRPSVRAGGGDPAGELDTAHRAAESARAESRYKCACCSLPSVSPFFRIATIMRDPSVHGACVGPCPRP